MLYPFFYFVFPSQYLEAAPQTFFAALQVAEEQISELENRIVNRFPNVSTINVSETAAELGELMTRLAGILDFFALFSIGAGGLILISSILATRLARVREAAYYKIMGADWRFVTKVFFYENLTLGMVSAIVAVVVAQIAAWAVCFLVFEVGYQPYLLTCLLAVGGVVSLVVILGLVASIPVIRNRPASFLRSVAA
jgi:putative ABC transport system permease protein